MTGFKSIQNKWFHLTFENVWTVSVQFGPGSYCQRQRTGDYAEPLRVDIWDSRTAEIAAWDSDGKFLEFESDVIKGECSADEVAAFIQKIQELPREGTNEVS